MTVDFSRARWRKSSYTGNQNCVELAHLPGVVGVRDSKDPDGPVLVFTPGQMNALFDRLKAGGLRLRDTAGQRDVVG